ncbi:hypothetical protein M7I_5927 [Glarea lozoyensis 74030]|uniref:Uncharacterized protein n=1 Tax=Glarea lozoyensis (strain ATCC 74030 / MF5533) TaxID=1104152 RepID=H0ET72_GLAL7|nr:hypothetical protein M7I_5927 [Glarea lozoyensis 74030]
MFDETPTDPYNNNFHEYAYLNRYNVFGDPRLDVISDKEVDQSADETVDEDYGEMDWSAEEHGSVEDDTSEDSENDTSPKQSQSSQSDLSDSCGSPANEKLSELVVQEEAALPPPVFEFTFTVEHNINLSIEVTPPEDTSITTPPTLSKLPENRKRKAIHSLMEMMTLSENISPKYNPTTMPSPEETAKRRRLGTFPIPTTNLPLSVYNPSARSTSKPPDPKRLKIYFHKACLHRVDYKTLPEILETYESTTNLIRTADANHFFIAEPRWCTDCIFMKSSSLRVNYPEPSSLTKRDLLIHAKEKGLEM